jgi:NADH-quinone oxidoreductase subunit L
MALSGVPIFFSGFWSKDEILHAARDWSVSRWPLYLGIFGALLTAFYMTRQICYVFFGQHRNSGTVEPAQRPATAQTTQGEGHQTYHSPALPHESPAVMTIPLVILAVFAVLLGFIGTPAWPWFQDYLTGQSTSIEFNKLLQPEVISTLLISTVIVALGIGLGRSLYGRKPITDPNERDVLERFRPGIFAPLKNKFYVDEFYEATVIRFNAWAAWFCDWLDYWIWNGAVVLVSRLVLGLSWLNRFFDEHVVNFGFDEGCRGLGEGGKGLSRLQDGRVQDYLRVIGLALTVLVLVLIWGCRSS